MTDQPSTAAGLDPAAVLERQIAEGRAAVLRGQTGRASRIFGRALNLASSDDSLRPQVGRITHHLTAAHAVAGNYAAVTHFFRIAAAEYTPSHPLFPDLEADRAWAMMEAGICDEAREVLARVAERAAYACDRVCHMGNLAVSLALAGHASAARGTAKRVEADPVGEAWAWYSIANVRYILGDRSQAVLTPLKTATRLATEAGEGFTRARSIELRARVLGYRQ
jgi:hypothetical protein